MTATVALIYSTSEGHTTAVAERIASRIRAAGPSVDAFPVTSVPGALAGYDGVLVGGSVHTGHHAKELVSWVRQHRTDLMARPSAFFSVSLSAAGKDEASQANASRVASEFVQETGWRPDFVALVGGALLYTRYGLIKRFVMKKISAGQGGDTDTSRDFDYTDWKAVDRFTDDFVAHMAEVTPGAPAMTPVGHAN